MSAAEIIEELPELNGTGRRAILEKLRELADQDNGQWERTLCLFFLFEPRIYFSIRLADANRCRLHD